MTLKRILVLLTAIFTLCIFTIPTFAFYNPGYDEEQELFPGSAVTPYFSTIEVVRSDPDADAVDLDYDVGYQDWSNKPNGFVILNQNFEYYYDQLIGQSSAYSIEMTIEATNYSGSGKSARFLVEPIRTYYLKNDGTYSDYMNCGWSFQFDFDNELCIISKAYGGTIEPITVYTLTLPVDIKSYQSTNNNTVHVASIDVRFLLDAESERCALYTRSAGNYLYREIISANFVSDIWSTRYLTYDRINSSGGEHIVVRDIKINDNISGQYFFDAGYAEGYADGENDGKSEMAGKLDEEYWKGYNEGKRVGELNVQVSELSIPEIFDSITGSTINLFRSIFGFEIFGINISALIGSIAVVAVVAWLIRKLVK